MNIITQERLKELLNYDPETGWFTWKIRTSNRIKIGDIAGCPDLLGYTKIRLDGDLYLGHRLAWLYMYNEWPDIIDHINGVTHMNSINNLRSVCKRVNQENCRKARSGNESGFLGVSKDKRIGKYRARIYLSGKEKWLGYFNTPEEAHEAYLKGKRLLHEGCTI